MFDKVNLQEKQQQKTLSNAALSNVD